jgi:hypothetical protein
MLKMETLFNLTKRDLMTKEFSDPKDTYGQGNKIKKIFINLNKKIFVINIFLFFEK